MTSRIPSFHGAALNDPMYHSGPYEEPYGASRGAYGEAFQPFPAQGGYAAYQPQPPLVHQHQQYGVPPYADSYEDSPLSEPAAFFPGHDHIDRGRTLSTGPYGPAVAPPLGSYPSQHYGMKNRSRRASTPGPGMYGVPMAPVSLMASDGGYHQRTGATIKFRAKGEYHAGISLSDATGDVPLSRSYRYSFHELRLGHRGRMFVRVRWNGYRPLNYEIPVTGYSDGWVNMQSLARRLARAIGHFLQTNAITIPWDRVILHRLEEETPGVWLPVLTTM